MVPEEIERRLQQVAHLPSKVVASGNGLHAYWLFKELLEATPQNVERCRGVASATRRPSRLQCTEASRLMRLPGSHNTEGRRLDRGEGHRGPAVALRARRPRRMAGDRLAGYSPQAGRATARPTPSRSTPGSRSPTASAASRRSTSRQRLAAMRYQGTGDAAIHSHAGLGQRRAAQPRPPDR